MPLLQRNELFECLIAIFDLRRPLLPLIKYLLVIQIIQLIFINDDPVLLQIFTATVIPLLHLQLSLVHLRGESLPVLLRRRLALDEVGIHEDLQDALRVLQGAQDLGVHQLGLWEGPQTLEKGTGLLFAVLDCRIVLLGLLLLGGDVTGCWLLEFGLRLLIILWLILKHLSLSWIDWIIWLRTIEINVSWLNWYSSHLTASHVCRSHRRCLIPHLIPWSRIALIVKHLKYIRLLVLSGIGVVRSPCVSLTSRHFVS